MPFPLYLWAVPALTGKKQTEKEKVCAMVQKILYVESEKKTCWGSNERMDDDNIDNTEAHRRVVCGGVDVYVSVCVCVCFGGFYGIRVN